MILICQSHKRKCEYICLSQQCSQQNSNLGVICSKCVLNGKHKSHQVVDIQQFIDQLHNTINSELNLKQYSTQIDLEVQQLILATTEYLTLQCSQLKSQLKSLYKSYLKDRSSAITTLEKLSDIAAEQNQEKSVDEDVSQYEIANIKEVFQISKYDIQQLIHLYKGERGIVQIVESTQIELQKLINAVNHLVYDQYFFDDFKQTFQNPMNLINNQITTLDINQQESSMFHVQNNLTLDGKFCFCQIDSQSLLIASQGSIKLVDVHTKSIKNLYPYMQLRQGFDIEIKKVLSKPGQFFYYNIGQRIVEMRSIYKKNYKQIFKFNFSVTSCIVSHTNMFLGTSEGQINIFNTKNKKQIYSIQLDLSDIIISLKLLSPNILLAAQIDDFEVGVINVLNLKDRSLVRKIQHQPTIELENYNIEIIKINQQQFVCAFGDLRKINLNPYEDNLLSKYSIEWEIYNDCQVIKKRFLLLKEIDYILVYDLLTDKVIAEIQITKFLMSKVIGIYIINNYFIMITDRGKITFQSLNIPKL